MQLTLRVLVELTLGETIGRSGHDGLEIGADEVDGTLTLLAAEPVDGRGDAGNRALALLGEMKKRVEVGSRGGGGDGDGDEKSGNDDLHDV